MKKLTLFVPVICIGLILGCDSLNSSNPDTSSKETNKHENNKDDKEFAYVTEHFADLKILRYQIPGFDELTKKQKELCYYLYEAALAGRDIIWDQNYKHNLYIRRTLEAIVNTYSGDKNSEDYHKFSVFTKRVWFSNGIHHHYSNNKIVPEFTEDYFALLVKKSDKKELPLQRGESVQDLISKITNILYNPDVAPKKVNLNPEDDLVASSATNFYEDVAQKEVESFYKTKINSDDKTPISHGLNSKVTKRNGKIIEQVWKVGGMYTEAIEKIVYWLELAITVAENEQQKLAFEKLVEYYKTGDLKKFDEYSIAWVNDINSTVDVINGFIEVYGDPLGYKGSFESVVSIKDMEATKRIEAIGKEAQWFEDNSSIMANHKKENVTGISAKVITVVVESGDASPSTPIGINLPNANWS